MINTIGFPLWKWINIITLASFCCACNDFFNDHNKTLENQSSQKQLRGGLESSITEISAHLIGKIDLIDPNGLTNKFKPIPKGIAFHPKLNLFYIASSSSDGDEPIYLIDASTGNYIDTITINARDSGLLFLPNIRGLDILSDNELICLDGNNQTLLIIDLQGEIIKKIPVPLSTNLSDSLSLQGIAAQDEKKRYTVLDVDFNLELRKLIHLDQTGSLIQEQYFSSSAGGIEFLGDTLLIDNNNELVEQFQLDGEQVGSLDLSTVFGYDIDVEGLDYEPVSKVLYILEEEGMSSSIFRLQLTF